ncbi:hypothetical protein [Chitinivibrio alkaliphilus]|uniref:Outer membrane protein beta-barrel domain-containing protein n=1 Tax=Chitinivibrio alkaliphilus ACht1 TaxID=1313304 RepID=U7DA36_9BACT|nr:hypothetical protein [Chitinivibrio alkaliphilus]ERP31972.1 hypothetical protein CALK_1194 [Chitinivibrio alkaliphilus ACht1]
MKKTVCFIVLLAGLLFASEDQASFDVGIGTRVGIDGFGASGRVWIGDNFAATIGAGSTYDREREWGELYATYTIPTSWPIAPYALWGVGLQRVDLVEMDPVEYNHVVWNTSWGIGGEMFFGDCQSHGVALEVTYRTGGKLEYRGESQTGMGDENQVDRTVTENIGHGAVRLLYHFNITRFSRRDRAEEEL